MCVCACVGVGVMTLCPHSTILSQVSLDQGGTREERSRNGRVGRRERETHRKGMLYNYLKGEVFEWPPACLNRDNTCLDLIVQQLHFVSCVEIEDQFVVTKTYLIG